MAFCGVTAVIILQDIIYAHVVFELCSSDSLLLLAVGTVPTRLSCPRSGSLSARFPGRGERSLVSIHFSMVVHEIRLAPPPL